MTLKYESRKEKTPYAQIIQAHTKIYSNEELMNKSLAFLKLHASRLSSSVFIPSAYQWATSTLKLWGFLYRPAAAGRTMSWCEWAQPRRRRAPGNSLRRRAHMPQHGASPDDHSFLRCNQVYYYDVAGPGDITPRTYILFWDPSKKKAPTIFRI
jgi:hypothetical protein